MAQKNNNIALYPLAYTGSRTAWGGTVVGSAGNFASNPNGSFQGALVGDKVHYEDGTQAVITSGAGCALKFENRPYAIVGSHVSGGDHIVSSPELNMLLNIDDDNRPDGFLTVGYVPAEVNA